MRPGSQPAVADCQVACWDYAVQQTLWMLPANGFDSVDAVVTSATRKRKFANRCLASNLSLGSKEQVSPTETRCHRCWKAICFGLPFTFLLANSVQKRVEQRVGFCNLTYLGGNHH